MHEIDLITEWTWIRYLVASTMDPPIATILLVGLPGLETQVPAFPECQLLTHTHVNQPDRFRESTICRKDQGDTNAMIANGIARTR